MDRASNGILCSLKKGTVTHPTSGMNSVTKERHPMIPYPQGATGVTFIKIESRICDSKGLEVRTGGCILMDIEISSAR